MGSFSFVILNYNSTNETIDCIRSIEKLQCKDKNIIVVDNCSTDQEELFNRIRSTYKSKLSIICLASTENLGYANGNNIGIDYARKILRSEFVCVLNPDVLVESDNFIEKSIELFRKYNYSVLGPEILFNGLHTNPLGGHIESVWKCVMGAIEDMRIFWIKKLRLHIPKVIKKIIKTNKGTASNWEESINRRGTFFLTKEEELQLSGACLIFSPKFFDSFSGFCDETFLYCEECILACVCYNLGHKMLFSDEVKTIHSYGASTSNTIGDERLRRMFIHRVGAKSTIVLAKIYAHRGNKDYLLKTLNPHIHEYKEVI